MAGKNEAPGPEFLAPTEFFDFETPEVRAFTEAALAGATDPTEQAVRLFYAVRDKIRYDPYRMSEHRETYKASNVIATGAGYCIVKANLMTACARAAGIPAGIGLSDVTNHLCTQRLLDIVGGKTLFKNHGYSVLWLDGRWIKAAPTFNIELCDKFHVTPTEFDASADALFQEYDQKGRRHMEYVADHGMWAEFPYERVMADFTDFYPADIYERCRQQTAAAEAKAARRFEDEKPLS